MKYKLPLLVEGNVRDNFIPKDFICRATRGYQLIYAS